MSNSTHNSIRLLFAVLYISVIVLGASIGRAHPYTTLIISILLITSGLPASIFGLIQAEKYKKVFDFEPTMLFGKPSNGKSARTILMAITTLGFWSLFAGALLILVVF